MRDSVLECLPRKGPKSINEVKMGSKWGLLTTNGDNRANLCPTPYDLVIAIVKGDTSETAEKKAVVAGLTNPDSDIDQR